MTDSRPKTRVPEVPSAGTAFEQYGPALHRYLLRRLRHPEDASDLTQEIFERFIKKKDRAELVRNPLAYLYGIASHVVSEAHYAAQQSRVICDSELLNRMEEGFDAAAPEQLADQLGLRRDLLDALSSLPRNHLLAVLLVEAQEMSYDEAARATGFTRNTIATYLMHARAKLKLILQDYWVGKDSPR
jgi:RNA polymerase sigma-70 factor (ECF subfamily)